MSSPAGLDNPKNHLNENLRRLRETQVWTVHIYNIYICVCVFCLPSALYRLWPS